MFAQAKHSQQNLLFKYGHTAKAEHMDMQIISQKVKK
jgi:hypothetical protein